MGTSEATNRFLSATVQCLSTPDAQLRRSNSVSISASHTRCNKRNAKRRAMSIQQFPVTDHSLHKCRLSRQVICYSQQPESDKNGNKTWFGDIMSGLNVISDMLIGSNTVEFGEVKEKSDCRGATNSIVEEAWDLLRESVVYYCFGPIGTPAAKADATSS